MVKGRKGHYRELFVQIRKMGYTKVRVDQRIMDITPKMQLDRYKIHDIDLVIDRLKVKDDDRHRLTQSVQKALKEGKGMMAILEHDPNTYEDFQEDPNERRDGRIVAKPVPKDEREPKFFFQIIGLPYLWYFL